MSLLSVETRVVAAWLAGALVLAGCEGSPARRIATNPERQVQTAPGASARDEGLATLEAAALMETTPSGRFDHGAVWDADGAQMLIFGGFDGALRGDVWSLRDDGGSWAWGLLPTSGAAPSPRRGHTAVWDPETRQMLVFGGLDGGGFRNDLWSLAWSGGTWTWTEVSAAGPAPSPREEHTAVWDAEGQRMLVFGGDDGALRNDAWALSRTGATWTWAALSPEGVAPTARREHAAAWDPTHHQMLIIGGDDGELRDEVWAMAWDGSTWTWSQPAPQSNGPSPRREHSAVWDTSRQRVIIFGGVYNSSGSEYASYEAWEFAPDGSVPAWALVSANTVKPVDKTQASARFGQTAVWDPASEAMLVFGGSPTGGGAINRRSDAWSMATGPCKARWTRIAPAIPSPDTRTGHIALWDSDGGRLLVHGGRFVNTLSELWWATDGGSAWAWERFFTAGGAQYTRSGHTAVIDELGHRVLLYGGEIATGSDHATVFSWWPKDTSGSAGAAGPKPPRRREHVAVWDAADERMLVFGGAAVSAKPTATLLGDLWSLDPANSLAGWSQLTPLGPAPSAREGATAVWDAAGQRMVVFGGYDGAYLNDVWALTKGQDTWTWAPLAPSGTPPAARSQHVAVWDADGQQMIVYGGFDGADLGDAQALVRDGDGWAWTALNPSGPPPEARSGHAAAWDAAGRRMLVVGGAGTDGPMELWSLTQQDGGWAWSALWGACETEVVAPSLQFPADGAALDACEVTLGWSDGGDLSGYAYVVELDGQPVASKLAYPDGATEVVVTPALGPHTWSVRAMGCSHAGAQSETRTFTVLGSPAPPAPALTPQPSGPCTRDSPARTFVWTTAPETHYDLLLNGAVVAADLTAGEHTLPVGTPYEASNSWQVLAKRCAAQTQSAPSEFTLSSPVVPLPPDLTAPAAGSVIACAPTLVWTYPGDAAAVFFDLLRADGSSLALGLTGTSWTPTGTDSLPAGPHNVRLRARTCAGDVATAPAQAFVLKDTPRPPKLQFPTDGVASSAEPVMSWSVDGPQPEGVVYDLYLDCLDAPYIVGLTGLSWTVPKSAPLAASPHSWRVVARGCFGTTASSDTATFWVDPSPPEPFLLLSPPDGSWFPSADPPQVLKWQPSSDAQTSVAFYRVLLDTASIAVLDPGLTEYTVPPALSVGNHTWTIGAVDAAGNQRTPASWIFSIDPEPPGSFDLLSPPPDALVQAPTVEFEWAPADDPFSGIAHYELFIDEVLDSAVGDVTSAVPATPLTDGPHTWYVRAVDKAGNTRLSSQVWTFDFAYTPLSAPTLLAVSPRSPDGAYVISASPTFTFSKDPASGQALISHFRVLVDGKPYGQDVPDEAGACAPNYCVTATTPLKDGPHTWSVLAVDSYGLTVASLTEPFTVEVDPPAAFGHQSPYQGSTVESTSPTFCWNPSSDAGAGLAGYEVVLKGPSPTTWFVPATAAVGAICSQAPSVLATGSYTWLVTALDHAGRLRAANSGNAWFVKVTGPLPAAPTSAITQPSLDGTISACPLPTFIGTATTSPDPIKLYPTATIISVQVQVDATSFYGWKLAKLHPAGAKGTWQWEWSWPDPTSGEHTLYVRALDSNGKTQPVSAARTFQLDCVQPTPAVLVDPADGACVGPSTATLAWSSCEDAHSGVASVELWVDGAKSAVTPYASGSVVALIDVPPGAHRWYVACVDRAGNARRTDPRGFFADTVAPSVGAVRVTSAGGEVFATIGASDAAPCGVARVAFAVDGGGWSDASVTPDADWLAPLGPLATGHHELAVRAFDGVANVSAALVYQLDVGPCWDLGACDPATGHCAVASEPGKPCGDEDACVVRGCEAGACVFASATPCDDGDGCTADDCAPDSGCQNTQISGCCNTLSPCGLGSACQDAACVDVLCEPCTEATGCGTGGRCAALPSGDYCLADCSGAACPNGTVCSADAGELCVPEAGDCVCSAGAGAMCVGDAWVDVDSCGALGEVLATCAHGCVESTGCCDEGTEASAGACQPLIPDEEVAPDADGPDAAEVAEVADTAEASEVGPDDAAEETGESPEVAETEDTSQSPDEAEPDVSDQAEPDVSAQAEPDLAPDATAVEDTPAVHPPDSAADTSPDNAAEPTPEWAPELAPHPHASASCAGSPSDAALWLLVLALAGLFGASRRRHRGSR